MDLWSSSVSSEPWYTLSVVDLHKKKGRVDLLPSHCASGKVYELQSFTNYKHRRIIELGIQTVEPPNKRKFKYNISLLVLSLIEKLSSLKVLNYSESNFWDLEQCPL